MAADSDPRRVAVTGAASGIGKAIAQDFADAGDEVFMLDRRADELSAATERIPASRSIVCDVQFEEQVASAFAAMGPRLDVLVIAAGITGDTHIESMTEHDWSTVLATNLSGAFLCMKHAIPLLRGGRSPSVVAVSSISAHVIGAGGGCAAYEASKAGLTQLVKAFAVEHAPDGIRANVVSPGRVATDLGRHTKELIDQVYTTRPDHRRPRLGFQAPLRLEARPSEIAAAVRFLSGEDAGFVSGADLVVDGGYISI